MGNVAGPATLFGKRQPQGITQQATERVKPEMVRKIRNLINRIVSEGPAQKALIKKLNQALKDSEKEKAQAEKKKEQEQNSETSENKK